MNVMKKDAVRMICPMGRARDNPDNVEMACLGNVCMAWRWADSGPNYATYMPDDETLLKATDEPKRPEAVPASWTWRPYDPAEDVPACWVEDSGSWTRRRIGYCGMAGVPDEREAWER